MIDCINQSPDCKISYGLVWDGLFTNWKFGFAFDRRLRDIQRLVLELFHFVFWFFWRIDTIFAELNKPPL